MGTLLYSMSKNESTLALVYSILFISRTWCSFWLCACGSRRSTALIKRIHLPTHLCWSLHTVAWSNTSQFHHSRLWHMPSYMDGFHDLEFLWQSLQIVVVSLSQNSGNVSWPYWVLDEHILLLIIHNLMGWSRGSIDSWRLHWKPSTIQHHGWMLSHWCYLEYERLWKKTFPPQQLKWCMAPRYVYRENFSHPQILSQSWTPQIMSLNSKLTCNVFVQPHPEQYSGLVMCQIHWLQLHMCLCDTGPFVNHYNHPTMDRIQCWNELKSFSRWTLMVARTLCLLTDWNPLTLTLLTQAIPPHNLNLYLPLESHVQNDMCIGLQISLPTCLKTLGGEWCCGLWTLNSIMLMTSSLLDIHFCTACSGTFLLSLHTCSCSCFFFLLSNFDDNSCSYCHSRKGLTMFGHTGPKATWRAKAPSNLSHISS